MPAAAAQVLKPTVGRFAVASRRPGPAQGSGTGDAVAAGDGWGAAAAGKPAKAAAGSASANDDRMLKVNANHVEEITWTSPKKKFTGAGKEISEALGRKPLSHVLDERHPFDVEILRIPAGATPYPFHSHSEQWEFYHVIAGTGIARHDDGKTPIEPGDAFLFKPGEAHQLINDGPADLLLFVVADNPIGESAYFPDSEKWVVKSPQRRVIRSAALDYFDGEE